MEKGYVFVPYIIAESTNIVDCSTDFILKLRFEQRKKKLQKIMEKMNDKQ